MYSKILTISIAAYNVEKYIRKTLDSVAIHEILDDIEVIVVDDGGTDKSLEIAKEYEEKFPNTFKAIHKKNGGYGSTVNYSVKIANGKYFKLLDGDDWFDKDGLINLVNFLKNTDSDVVFTQYCYAVNDCNKLAIEFKNDKIDNEMPIEDFYLNEGTPMHSITYKTDIIRKSNMLLKEHSLYTDNIYAMVPFKCANTIVFKNILVYYYRLGVDGQSVNRKSLIKHFDESKNISLFLAKYYSEIENLNLKSINCMKINAASTCVNCVAAILKMKMNVSSLKLLKEFDDTVYNISKPIYEKMSTLNRKCSKALNFIRKTNYMLYWLFAFIYRFID